jgi:trehalose 6-phosphate phosphatase
MFESRLKNWKTKPIARTPRLLVACDYDGTLAPIVADPWSAYPLPETVAALRSLAILPETTTAVISGRALRELAVLSRLPAEVHLVGSHGTEFDVGFLHALEEPARVLRRRLLAAVRDLAGDAPGVILEVKPASVAVHVRSATREKAEQVLSQVRSGPGRWDGVQATEGNAVLELSVLRTDKGDALDVIRQQCGATAVVFLGDSVSDEKV